MKNRKLVGSFICSILIVGCSALPAPSAEPTTTLGEPISTSVLPEVINPTTTTIPLPQPQAQPSLIVAATVAPVPFIGGSGVPLASTNGVSLNCRGGPDVRWPVGDVLDPGEIVQVAGRNPDNSWWYVTDPAAPMGSCWVAAEFVTITGDISGVQIVVPDGPVPVINGTPVGTITSVLIVLEPDTIDVPGCVGPSQSIHIAAKIKVDGPVAFKFHFEGDQVDNLGDHRWTFTQADIDDVTDSFIPPLEEGTHYIYLIVDDMDLQGVGSVATYTITC